MSFNNWLDAYAAYELVGRDARGLGGHREAQQPVRRGVPRLARRFLSGAPSRATWSARSAASWLSRARSTSMPRRDGRGFHRGRDRARLSPAAARGVRRTGEPPGRLRPARRTPAASTCGRFPGGALVQDRDGSARRGRIGRWFPAVSPRQAEWADLGARLDDRVAREVQHDRARRDGATVGIGAGQMSRVDSSWIATRKAGDRAQRLGARRRRLLPVPGRARGRAADAGCTAVIHPGGSKGDEEVLAAAEAARHGGGADGHASLPPLIGRSPRGAVRDR